MILTLAQASGFSFGNILLYALPLLGSVLLTYGIAAAAFDLRTTNRRKIVDRLRSGLAGSRDAAKTIDFESFRRQSVEAKGFLAAIFSRLRFTARFQHVLEQANLPWSAPQTLVNLTAISSVLFAGLLVARISVLTAAGSGVAVFILPIMYFVRRRNKRIKKLMAQLPDVFELLSQALRAGNSLPTAMQLIATELPDPASTEFGRVFHEQNLGLKIDDALKNLAERVDVLDVRFFVTAVLIQRQVGGDLAEVLDKIGAVIRERIQLFGMVQALTAEGRLSGYVLLALPVVIFGALMYINYGYITLLLTDPLGKMMLTAAIVMQLMGWAMIKKIVNIKV